MKHISCVVAPETNIKVSLSYFFPRFLQLSSIVLSVQIQLDILIEIVNKTMLYTLL